MSCMCLPFCLLFSRFVTTPVTLWSTLPWTCWWKTESVKEWSLCAWRTGLFTASEPRILSLLLGRYQVNTLSSCITLVECHSLRNDMRHMNVYKWVIYFFPGVMEEPISAAHLPTLVQETEMQWWPEPVCPARIWSLYSFIPLVRKNNLLTY